MFILEEELFSRFKNIIREKSGLQFAESRRRDLLSGILDAMKDAGFTDPEAYYRSLSGLSAGSEQWERLIRQVTVGETYFFRDQGHFNALRDNILPDLIARRRAANHHLLRIWSAGCATGEEPYSLAILLRELLPDLRNWQIMILGTDINQNSLKQAQRGIYRNWSFRAETPERIRGVYFRERGGLYHLNDDVRRMVAFQYLNLAEECYPSYENHTFGLDVILCRNVLLYFDQQAINETITRFKSCLVDDGWLILGHSEPTVDIMPRYFQPRYFTGAVIYQKKPDHPRPVRRPTGLLPSLESVLAAAPKSVQEQAAQGEQEEEIEPYDRALAFVEDGQPAEAERVLREQLSESPDDADSLWLLGKIAADAQRWDDAYGWLDKAEKANPLLVQVHFLKALIYEHEDDVKNAVRAIRRALYLDHTFVLGHFNLANLYWRAGEHTRARRSWRNADVLLQDREPDEVLPFSDGMTAGRLRSVLRQRMQQKS